jgi:hypothetical protein
MLPPRLRARLASYNVSMTERRQHGEQNP